MYFYKGKANFQKIVQENSLVMRDSMMHGIGDVKSYKEKDHNNHKGNIIHL